MLYPLFFSPIYKERVWGGTKLKDLYDRELPYEHTGESWDVACHPEAVSVICNGDFRGTTLLELFQTQPDELLGKTFAKAQKFPLLVKLLDAQEKLSVQVHPKDAYAKKYENGELGKYEMWYIIDAPLGATVVAGLKPDTTKEQFEMAVRQGTVESYLMHIPVTRGDVIYVPAGLVHALEENIVLAEIQQNSDTVYRVYDWNRLGLDGQPRELHVQKALDVIDFATNEQPIVKGLSIYKKDAIYTYYIATPYFAVEKIQLTGEIEEDTKSLKFYLYTCVEGRGIIKHNEIEYNFCQGQSFMIPGSAGQYKIKGDATLLKSYIPHIDKDFIQPLQAAGYTAEEIEKQVAILEM
ncbi:MAG: class I mannose-6-phosphate isomerase [Epulopiscium sp.]|nr:class I mannose-6-phosphate isomerase [Candidatus Epulonipiscium sp.]